MIYAIGNDHGGIDLYDSVKEKLEDLGHEVIHVGTNSKDSVDYSDFAQKACQKVLDGQADFAILICGTGLGMSISANKIDGIRAACVSEAFSARMSRAHNNANCLCIGARVIGNETAKMIVEEFVKTEFEGGRHQRRVDKITEIEKR
ncbi:MULTISPECIES: ribose 5-phosphate isomerase B [Anaerococcus]|jgi:ribose-5-phosphate isomerase B|uniref:Ribose-5-phosphate isomerase B n=1 Tax=Anaerococcus octavius TaxID=54007 RepID=A0A2I1MA19_9FIRM|nr:MULTISPECIES: ribose 5-phosphate isomerase B [Anaerococcus]MBS6105669.1 ribose 5-phosphate isomerase B [Anaerococcus sp.]MDU2599183.1 ribose 5-phosphate isomerase B [Anaerococcus sp.]MDU3176360.1 ribose 5-phosphate isomerase B [Anaerococcus sp.]MDU4025337.1 ribose 5-phosphate isomerase B [Anaerococcus sp.]MDU5229097.1 ribose 5-phosphate isomerase B [Anaerococcus sp.]